MKGELGCFMKPTKPEAWDRCSTEERINRLFEYILPRVDYFKCPVSKDDIYQQTALVYLEAITNEGNQLSFRQMCNHCLNRVRYYLKTVNDVEIDHDSIIDEECYLMLRDLTDMVSDDFRASLDQILTELEKDSYHQVWFDTYRSEVGIPIQDPERSNEIADLSKPAIRDLWDTSKRMINREIYHYVVNLGFLPEAVDFNLACDNIRSLGHDSIFSETFY